MLRRDVRRQDLVARPGPGNHDASVIRLTSRRELGARLHHRLGGREDDGRLLAVGSSTVYLTTFLPVGGQKVEPDAGDERRLAVLARNLDVGDAIPAGAVRPLPAKKVPDDVALPGLEDEGLTGPLSFDVDEHVLEEGARPFGGFLVEPEATLTSRSSASPFRSRLRHRFRPGSSTARSVSYRTPADRISRRAGDSVRSRPG